MRQSLEEAHEALLQRVHDMESVVDAERNQVNELVTNWDNTRQQEAATKEAFANEHELRMQLEALLTQQEHDFGELNNQTLLEKLTSNVLPTMFDRLPRA